MYEYNVWLYKLMIHYEEIREYQIKLDKVKYYLFTYSNQNI